jgi:AraC-like DNA-binding protein
VEVRELIFAFDDRNFRECQDRYRGARNLEYYGGDYTIDAGAEISVQAEKQAAGPFSINRLRSTTRLSFRRRWRHIRQDNADLVVLWFVKSGQIALTYGGGQTVVDKGGCVFTRSVNPFHMECLLGDDAEHETLHVVLPGHVLDGFPLNGIRTGLTLSARSGEGFIADQIFSALFATETQVPSESAEQLIRDALLMMAQRVRLVTGPDPGRQTLSQRRLTEIGTFIDIHLANPLLCTEMVAKGCGISSRYVSFLLKSQGISFSKLIWDMRLQKAKAWLTATTPEEIFVSEVAHRLGFKSAAHFSRMYKAAFGKSPSEHRRALELERGTAGSCERALHEVPETVQ